MLQEERYTAILSEIALNGASKVCDLALKLGSSESTIRRDINELDSAGKLKKVFGGAVAVEKGIKTVLEDVESKSHVRIREKEAVAKYAASLIEDNDFIFIDAGTTTERMIDFIDNPTVTCVTNGIIHGQKLAAKGLKVYMVGGKLHSATLSIIGAEAVNFIGKCNFSKCFMGANGIEPERGFTTPDFDEAMVKEVALKHSQAAYVLADSSKFGCVSAATFGRLEQGTIITDKLNDKEFKKYTIIKEVGL